MTTLSPTPPGPMTAAEFLDWAAREDVGRVELIGGEVVVMAGETQGHNRVKDNLGRALDRSLDAVKTKCERFSSGLAVIVADNTAFIPDMVVDCAPSTDMTRMDAAEPVIVIEVLSPSTRRKDLGEKLQRYFEVSTIAHYITVDWADRRVMHHARHEDGILTTIHGRGSLSLDPPGIAVDIDEFWRGLPAPTP